MSELLVSVSGLLPLRARWSTLSHQGRHVPSTGHGARYVLYTSLKRPLHARVAHARLSTHLIYLLMYYIYSDVSNNCHIMLVKVYHRFYIYIYIPYIIFIVFTLYLLLGYT